MSELRPRGSESREQSEGLRERGDGGVRMVIGEVAAVWSAVAVVADRKRVGTVEEEEGTAG